MPWSKLDDGFHEHAKIVAMSDKAFRLYVCSITYSSRHKLDGHLKRLHVNVLFRLTGSDQTHDDELVALNAWDANGSDRTIHGFSEYNPDQEGLSEKRAAAGRLGAARRWQNGKRMANAGRCDSKRVWQTDGKGSPDPLGSGQAVTESLEIHPESGLPRLSRASKNGKEPDGFGELWELYPRHTARAKAVEAFRKAVPDEATLCAILAGVRRSMKNPQWSRDNGQYIPHLSTYLNGRRWEDEDTPHLISSTLEDYAAEEMAAIERMHL